MKYNYPLTTIFSCGYTEVVTNQYELQALITKFGWFGFEWLETEYTRMFRYRPCAETLPRDYQPRYFTVKRFEWIVRDNYGQKVDPELIELDWPASKKPWWYYGKKKAQQSAADKGLPIPHLSSRRKRYNKKYIKKGGIRSHIRDKEDFKIFIKKNKYDDFD